MTDKNSLFLTMNRRKFVAGATTLAFAGLLSNLSSKSLAANREVTGYGPLVNDPNEILDLPKGFKYQVISELGDIMDDGLPVPDRADGMGCIPLDDNRVALIRNHEVDIDNHDPAVTAKYNSISHAAFDHFDNGEPHPGGTTTIIYDITKAERVDEYQSLVGTIRNCAGGVTPWGTWLSCEETMRRAGNDTKHDHGWVFEVSAADKELKKPVPLKALGRFNHEAAAVDPKTGIVYMTEDRPNSLFYRFIPNVYGDLVQGGRLQALGIVGEENGRDSRNWDDVSMEIEKWYDVRWVDLEDIDSPTDNLRVRGHRSGAVIFARGEGIHWGDNELYFCCTSGGAKKLGQVMRYQPSDSEGADDEKPGRLQLFFESADINSFGLGDNLVVAPNGHLLVCEDHYDGNINHIRGITPSGEVYTVAKLNIDTETAGACFSPDGKILFVNVYSPTKTLAITGPWDRFKI